MEDHHPEFLTGVKEAAKNGSQRAQLYLGTVYFDTNDFEKALPLLEKGTSLPSNQPWFSNFHPSSSNSWRVSLTLNPLFMLMSMCLLLGRTERTITYITWLESCCNCLSSCWLYLCTKKRKVCNIPFPSALPTSCWGGPFWILPFHVGLVFCSPWLNGLPNIVFPSPVLMKQILTSLLEKKQIISIWKQEKLLKSIHCSSGCWVHHQVFNHQKYESSLFCEINGVRQTSQFPRFISLELNSVEYGATSRLWGFFFLSSGVRTSQTWSHSFHGWRWSTVGSFSRSWRVHPSTRTETKNYNNDLWCMSSIKNKPWTPIQCWPTLLDCLERKKIQVPYCWRCRWYVPFPHTASLTLQF